MLSVTDPASWMCVRVSPQGVDNQSAWPLLLGWPARSPCIADHRSGLCLPTFSLMVSPACGNTRASTGSIRGGSPSVVEVIVA